MTTVSEQIKLHALKYEGRLHNHTTFEATQFMEQGTPEEDSRVNVTSVIKHSLAEYFTVEI